MRARRLTRQGAIHRPAPSTRSPAVEPQGATVGRLRRLQTAGGNRAVARLFARTAEQEAAVRDRAGRHPDRPPQTGALPDALKSGVEQISGVPMRDVRVHYNSAKPAELQAHAFARGTDIHLAPGQERHLPHEAWHIVQQAQGKVQPTASVKDGIPMNADPSLEHEADVMGRRAHQMINATASSSVGGPIVTQGPGAGVMQAKAPEKRPPGMKNDVWQGDDTGPLALPGSTFTSDPFDHTVVVVRADGTGTQYTYVAVDENEPGGPHMKLEHTEPLSTIRVKALAFLDASQGTFQEEATGPGGRLKKDQATHADDIKKWLEKNPDMQGPYNAYLEALKQYKVAADAFRAKVNKEKGEKPPTPPPPPKGMPEQPRTTLCNGFPPEMGQKIAGDRGLLGNFDPSVEGTKRGSWRTLETQPEGPKPGDVYSLGLPRDKKTIKHIGIFKSSRPGTGDMRIWTVVDGGQGTYESRQEVWERTRYFNTKTQILSTNLADAGQSAEDRSLRGWIDIEEHFKKEGS